MDLYRSNISAPKDDSLGQVQLVDIGKRYIGEFEQRYKRMIGTNIFLHHFPVGYHAKRTFANKEMHVFVKEGKSGPLFQVQFNEHTVTANSPERAVLQLHKKHKELITQKLDPFRLFGFDEVKTFDLLRELHDTTNTVCDNKKRKRNESAGNEIKALREKISRKRAEIVEKQKKLPKQSNKTRVQKPKELKKSKSPAEMNEQKSSQPLCQQTVEQVVNDEEDEAIIDELDDEEDLPVVEQEAILAENEQPAPKRPRRAAAQRAEMKTKEQQLKKKNKAEFVDEDDEDYDPELQPDIYIEEEDSQEAAAKTANVVVRNPYDKNKSILKTPDKLAKHHSTNNDMSKARLTFSPDVSNVDSSLEIKCPVCSRSFSKYQIHSHFKVRHMTGDEGNKLTPKERKAYLKRIADDHMRVEAIRKYLQKNNEAEKKGAKKQVS